MRIRHKITGRIYLDDAAREDDMRFNPSTTLYEPVEAVPAKKTAKKTAKKKTPPKTVIHDHEPDVALEKDAVAALELPDVDDL